MKYFPKENQNQYQQVTPDTVNTNPKGCLNEINGGLGSENMPVGVLTSNSFPDPQRSNLSNSSANIYKMIGATQSYHYASRYNDDFGSNDYDPLHAFDLITEDWNKGWNLLTTIDRFDAIILNFEAQDGMLNGVADINFNHGYNRVRESGEEPNLYFSVGYNWWTRWGVFVNGTLIAESGRLAPGRKNVIIPYSVPCGSQSVTVEIKWQSVTDGDINVAGYTGNPTTPLEMYGARIWCRNTYK